MKQLGLYVHIPFCVRKCGYCDFLSLGGQTTETMDAYIKALCREIAIWGDVYGNYYYVDTVFVGGGTPSLLSGDQMQEIIDTVRSAFPGEIGDRNRYSECSLEANPGTVSQTSLAEYRRAGFNRISIGIQSFDNELLERLGRIHRAEQASWAVEMARDAGFSNINIDLMFGLPDQTITQWKDSLEKAVELRPNHISFYSLELEEETPFGAAYRAGNLQLPDKATDRLMYHCAVSFLKDHGFEHYEISNSCIPGYECRHNLKYWNMNEYLGVGLGAHSFLRNSGNTFGVRHWNTRELERYLLAESQKEFVEGSQNNFREDEISDYLFTGLRKIKGISLLDFRNRFGADFREIYGSRMDSHILNGLLELVSETETNQETAGKWLRFTSLGLDHTNSVLAEYI